ncbi:DNA-directed RNA polymerases I and III subunit RPAC1 [Blattella germanica]|nr:DNA-directed RNA polymerases I and III subunit RPAC1 [Blattella germanica]
MWGCISSRGVGQVHLVEGSVSAEAYIKILQIRLTTAMQVQCGDTKNCSFQDDSAPSHRVNMAVSSDYPGSYDCDDTWSHEKFMTNFRVNVVKYDENEMEFDLIGIHAAIANAFRRLLLSEAYVFCDTEGTEQDTLEFELKVKCTWNPNAPKDSTSFDDMYRNHNVYTRHIRWLPIGNQGDIYKEENLGPVVDDILLCKMRPGHELDLKLHAVKGIGKDHAKFSPVSTAYYRLLPEITLTREIEGEPAVRLQRCFSPGVIDLVETEDGKKKAVVVDARYDTCSRNFYRYEDLKDAVRLGRVRDHFIFTVESVGALPPDVLFMEAVKLLKTKCRTYLDELNSSS